MLNNHCKRTWNSLNNEFLQEKRCEGPYKEQWPYHHTQKVIFLKCIVEIGFKEIAILNFTQYRRSKQKYSSENNSHIIESSEMRFIEFGIRVMFVKKRRPGRIWFFGFVRGSDIGVGPDLHLVCLDILRLINQNRQDKQDKANSIVFIVTKSMKTANLVKENNQSDSQVKLLKDYISELEAENAAKTNQIQILTKNLTLCSQEIQKLSLIQIIGPKQKPSTEQFNQQIRVPHCAKCQQNQAIINQQQDRINQLEQKLIGSSNKHPQNQKQVGSKTMKNWNEQKQEQTVFSIHQKLFDGTGQQISCLIKEKDEKIRYLEKRVFVLEDSNRILREQILDYIHKSKSSPPKAAQKQMSEPKQELITFKKSPMPFSTIYNSKSDNSMTQKAKQTPEPIHKQQKRHKKLPLFYVNYRNVSPLKRNQLSLQDVSIRQDSKNLVNEHTNNLQRRIKILLKQNLRLKQQISCLN